MKLFDKMKDLVLGSEDYDDFEDMPQEEMYGAEQQYEVPRAAERYEEIEPFEPKRQERSNKVIEFSQTPASAPSATYQRSPAAAATHSNVGGRPHVVVAKLEKFEDVGEVAKSINEKRMVVINLENADNATTQRIIDFIYGVTIANSSELKRVAFRTYIIKPAGYDYTGGDGFDGNNMDGIVFGTK